MNRNADHPQDSPPRGSSSQRSRVGSKEHPPIRILLVDDHTILREALASLLSLDPHLQIVGKAGTGRDALDMLSTVQPHLVIMDLSLPGIHGIEVIRQLKKNHPEIKVLVLTVHASDTFVRASLEAGASGYVVKEASYAELQLAITSVMANKTYLTPSITSTVMDSYLTGGKNQPGVDKNPWHTLTEREREILKFIAEGAKNKQIAECLCLSVRTVEKHRLSLMAKLNIKSTAALTAFAIEHGFVSASSLPPQPGTQL